MALLVYTGTDLAQHTLGLLEQCLQLLLQGLHTCLQQADGSCCIVGDIQQAGVQGARPWPWCWLVCWRPVAQTFCEMNSSDCKQA